MALIRQRISALRSRCTPGSQWVLWAANLAAGLLGGLVWSVLARLVESQSIRTTLSQLFRLDGRVWLTALFLGLLVLALSLLFHDLLAGNAVVGAAAMLLSFINYFKVLITATPLRLGDFGLVGKLGNIAGLNRASLSLSRNSLLALLAAVFWLTAAWFFAKPLRLRWKWSALGGLGTAAAFFLLFWLGLDGAILAPMNAGREQPMTQVMANHQCGPILGLWRSFYVSCSFGGQVEYSQAAVQQALEEAEQYTADVSSPAPRKQPNILLILSESFFDITKLEGVTFETDPVAQLHALQDEGVSGSFYTRSLGYGTCNIELEVFTGLNTGLLSGEDLYTLSADTYSHQPTVPGILRENGYRTSMIHMFGDSIYDRKNLFRYMGFDELYFSDDFAAFYPPAAQAEDYWAYLDTRISGSFYSDDLMADLLIAKYERGRSEGEGPQFLYASSMEAHPPYPGDKYKPEELTLEPVSPLSGQAADSLQVYCQSASNASAALGKLVDYFRTCDEPTVIVFYGDHKPGLNLGDGRRVYNELGLVSQDKENWTAEDYAYLYSTDYLIWANDPDYLPAAPGTKRDTSCSYLGSELLGASGVEQPLFWKVIGKLSQSRVADVPEFHIDRSGGLSRQLPKRGEDARGLSILRLLVQDVISGHNYAEK